MKKLLILLVGVFSLSLVQAQSGDIDDRYLELLLQSEKRTLINEAMALTPDESAAFRGIYDAYEAEFSEITKLRTKMLKDNGAAYPNVSDDLANSLVSEMYKANTQVYKLRNKYAKKVARSCSPQTAARWVQLDDMINTAIKLSLMVEIPLIEK